MLCQICNKNTAVLFMNRVENGEARRLALCLPCAQQKGLLKNMFNAPPMKPEDMQNLSSQMNEFMEKLSENGDLEGLEQMLPNKLMEMLTGASPVGNNEDDNPENDFSAETPSEDSPEAGNRRNHRGPRNDSLKALRRYSTDLTAKAIAGELDPIIGRDREIERMTQILNRRTKNNPVLIGEPGVGKTAIAEGLALRIAQGQLPEKFLKKRVFLLDMTGIVAGTQFRGQFEARMKAIIDEVVQDGNIILVIDEIHNLVGAGDAQNSMNAANILKPALASGKIQIIGTTTLDEYRRYIEKDSALERRFQPIVVDEPSAADTVEILKGLKSRYESFHNVHISDEVINDAVYLSKRYIHQRYLPDKAIDVLDEACARVSLKNTDLHELEEVKKKLAALTAEKDDAAQNGNFEEAARLRVEEIRLEKSLEDLKKKAFNKPLCYDDVAAVIEGWTKIPVKRLTHEEADKLMALEDHLHERLIGQNQAVSALARAIRRNRSGFRKDKKPASFIFAGPTGVGKTELVKTLAVELFGSEDSLIRVDMSEYMEKYSVSRLIGAAPGYVGYDEGGQLTEKVRRHPFSVILLDEIEKAHPDIFNLLLQILDDGRLTDSQGRTVSFENTVIIMTTNAGSGYKNNGLGFNSDAESSRTEQTEAALKELFRPEFLNRIDEIICFHSLTHEELREIVELMLKDVYQAGIRQSITVSVSDEVKDFLAENGYDPKYGARPLRRLIQRSIEDEIAEAFLTGSIAAGDTVSVILNEGKPTLLRL